MIKFIHNNLKGESKVRTIITFGQIHAHRVNDITFDKDCVAVIEAESHSKAREIAYELFGSKFGTSYTEEEFDNNGHIAYYYRGKLPANFRD